MSERQPETTVRDIVWLLRANADDCVEAANAGLEHIGDSAQAALDRRAADEIARLRSVIVGCEIALNRDDDVSAVRRLLVQERHANGY